MRSPSTRYFAADLSVIWLEPTQRAKLATKKLVSCLEKLDLISPCLLRQHFKLMKLCQMKEQCVGLFVMQGSSQPGSRSDPATRDLSNLDAAENGAASERQRKHCNLRACFTLGALRLCTNRGVARRIRRKPDLNHWSTVSTNVQVASMDMTHPKNKPPMYKMQPPPPTFDAQFWGKQVCLKHGWTR